MNREVHVPFCESLRGKFPRSTHHENNNTLKNLGYNLEHNFGHGKLYLSSMLASFNILAFLMHSALEIVDEDFARLVEKLKRSNVLKCAAVLTCDICFGGWQHLVGFMLDAFDKPIPPPRLGEVYYHPPLLPLNNSP